MADTLSILLSSSLNIEKSRKQIQRDLDLISKQLKLQITNTNIQGISKQASDAVKLSKTIVNAKTQETQAVAQKVQAVKKEISEIDKLILKYKAAKISATEFMNAGQKMFEGGSLSGTDTNTLKERAKLLSALTKAQKEYESSVSQESKTNAFSESNLKNIDLNIKNITNSLEQLKVGKEKVFADTRVSSEALKLDTMIEQFKRGEISSKDLSAQMNTLKTRVSQVSNEFKNVNRDGYGFSEMLTLAAKKLIIWKIAGDVVMRTLSLLQKMPDIVTTIDTSLVEINKVLDLSVSGLRNLSKEATELGIAYGKSTVEVLDSIGSFAKAGMDETTSKQFAQLALLLSNVGSISTEVAQETLIMANAGYQLGNSYETLNTLISQFNELANKNAVEVDTLAQGWQNSASIARQAKLEITDFNALLTVAGSVSQKSGKEVGNALRTWLMRLQGVTDGTDTLEEDVSKVDKVLKDLGIQLRKSPTEFRPAMEVIEELAQKYRELGETGQTVKQSELLEALAGKYRANIVAGVLNNFDMVNKAIQDQTNSFQSAEKENARYMDSIQAKTKALTAQWELFASNILDSALIKGIVDFGRIFLQVFDNQFSKAAITIGVVTLAAWGVDTAIKSIGKSSFGTAVGVLALDVAEKGLIATSKALWVTMSASPLFWVAAATAAVIGLVKVFDALNVSVEEQRQKVDELNKGYNELKDKIKSLRAVQNPTKEQIEYIGLLERELELQGEILKIEQKRLMEKEVYGSGRLAKEVEKNLQTIDEYTEGMKYAQSELQRVLSTYTEEELLKYSDDDTWIEHIEDLKDQTKELELELIKQKTTIDDYIKTLGNEAPQKLKDLSKSIEDALPKIQALNGGIKDTDTTTEKYIPTLEELTKAYEEATDAIDNYQSSAKQLSDIYDTINEDGKVSADTLIDLIQKYPQLASEIANMNSSKEAGLNLTKQLFELEKGNAIAELTDNKAILDSKLAILEADEKKYKLMREIAMQNNDSYGVGQASKLLAALDLGDLRNQSNAIVQAIGMITGLTLDDFQSKSSGSSSTSKTLTSMETVDQSKLTEAFIKSANAESKITEAKEKSLKAQQKLADSQKDYNKQIELTKKLISNEQQQISDLQTANEKINQRANEIRAGATGYDTTQWFDPTGESTAIYDNFIIGFTDRKNKIITEMNKLEAKSSLTKVEKEQLKSFENQLNALETEQKYVEDLFTSLQKLKKAWYENADSIIALNDDIASSNQKIIDIKKEELEVLEKEAEETRKNQIESQKQLLEKYKQQEESLKNIIDLTTNLIKQEYQDIIDKLEDQLDAHKEITDEIKKQIKLQEANDDYRKDEKKKQDEILKLQRKITELSRDDSRQAQAEKLKLEEDLAKKQEDLSEFRHDRDIELQLEALDEGQKAFEDKQKEEIDKYKQKLSEAGTLQQEAITRINDALSTGSDTLYDNLISWNQKYGSSIQDDIVSAWKSAKDAMLDYQSSSGGLNIEGAMTKTREAQIIAQMQQNSISWHGATSEERIRLHEENIRLAKQLSGSVEFLKGKWWQNGIPIYGQGAYVDKPHLSVVGDRPEFIIPKENIMDFVNKVNMMNIPIPKMPNFNPLQNSNALKIDSLITINGNADRTILPDLERIANTVVDKINNGFYKVGKMKPIRTLG